VPSAGAQVRFGVVGETGGGEDQRERKIGGGFVEHAGRVADHDTMFVGGADVDVVVADRDVRDDTQPACGRRRR